MKAYSPSTETTYDSYEDLLAAEANGYSVVSILRRTTARTRNVQTFARVLGPFEDKPAAQKAAARLRRRWKNALAQEPDVELLGVRIEPIFKELNP